MGISSLKDVAFRARRKAWGYAWAWRVRREDGSTMHRFALPDGSPFDYPIRSALGRELFGAHFESAEIGIFLANVRPGDVVFDIGANGGVFSVLASKKVGPAGRVYAFEPGPRERGLLEHNLALNECSNVHVLPYALSDANGTRAFMVSQDGAMNSFMETEHELQQVESSIVVQTRRLDDFASEQGIERVDFIKMDVEGAERLVLAGAGAILSRCKPRMIFEAGATTARPFGYTPADLIADVRRLGYRVSGIHRTGELVPADRHDDRFGTEIYNFFAAAG